MSIPLALSLTWLWAAPTNQWENPNNWQPNQVPTQNDSAIFQNSEQRNIHVTMGPRVAAIQYGGRESFETTIDPLAYLTINGPVTYTTHHIPIFILKGSYSSFGGQIGATANAIVEGIYVLKGYAGGNGAEFTQRGTATEKAYFCLEGGSYLMFKDNGNAGASTITTKPVSGFNGAQIYFYNNSDARDATIHLNDISSAIQIQDHQPGMVTVSELSGIGTVYIGNNTFSLGELFTVHLGRGVMTFNGSLNLTGKLIVYFDQPEPALQGHTFTLFHVTGFKSGNFDEVIFPAFEHTPNFKTSFNNNDFQITFFPLELQHNTKQKEK